MQVDSSLMTLSDNRSDEAVRHVALPAPDFDVDVVMGELTHAVANALHTVAAASDLAQLLLGRHKYAEATQTLQRVQDECMRTAHLMRDARAFMAFRIDSAHDAVDVVALAHACAAPLAGRVRVGADDTGVIRVRGDERALQRAFDEILVNAFQSGARGVQVAFARDVAGQSLSIDFIDDGPGVCIAPARAIQPFFSMLPGDHSGLGLALVARIAEAHGGVLAVRTNAAPHGARIRVSLPLPPPD